MCILLLLILSPIILIALVFTIPVILAICVAFIPILLVYSIINYMYEEANEYYYTINGCRATNPSDLFAE